MAVLGKEFQKIRESMGMGRREFGRAIGYTGTAETVWKTVKAYESDRKPIPPVLARLVFLMWRIKMGDVIPTDVDGNVQWPEWPLYQQENV